MAGVGPAGLFVLVLALVAKALYDNFYSLLPLNIGGHVDPQFKEVQEAFKQNFVDGWEKDGASLAVYRNGKKVVDLWGGYADRAATRKWSENTIQIAFSSTKGVAALTVALLVDRGRLEYDDLVTKFWPDFGKNGKANVTVQMIMSHMSGLAYFDEEVTEEQGTSHEKMRVLLENESPKWPPGTETGYHAVTYGWLVDQIVRHVDEKHRSVGAFFREEIAEPNGIDFYIGLPTSEEWRVARLSANTFLDSLSEVATDYRAIKYFLLMKKFFSDTHMKRVFTNTPWIMSFNDVDLHRIEQAAAFGIGNARSIARLFDLLVTGKLVSKKTSDQLQKWHVNKTDVVIDEHVAKGNGFFYFPLNRGGNQFSFGHPGHGCQNFVVDTKNKLTIAYTTSHLKLAQGGLCRTYARLQNAIYNVIEKE